ncbi:MULTISPECIES: hypothetical protein [Oceanobacillus]|uniref:Uncharacterized protein n=1 Tax=Oceanobacillus neutriphilus TaxID=531815 RepID=A0ABQ2NVY0_9BACI|nr:MULTISPECIES: hypothetical protein [Oceanobacillus]MCT1904598.1 hypothetical protein [Oceanobacillus sojae]GGP11902.1 hypothetical protein GCM10011346_25760 [Oceanobacillus neutriphilus]
MYPYLKSQFDIENLQHQIKHRQFMQNLEEAEKCTEEPIINNKSLK